MGLYQICDTKLDQPQSQNNAEQMPIHSVPRVSLLRLRVMPALSNKSQALNPLRDLGTAGSVYDLQPSQAIIRYAQKDIPKPLNLRTLMSQKVFDDDLKAQEVLFQYQKLSKYQRHQQTHKPLDSPCARLTSLFKSPDSNFVYLKHHRQPLQEDQPLIIDLSLNPSRTLTALLASNECLYFLHSGKLVGSRIYNRRHHGARRVKFSRVQSERVVVYGGPNGMVVYDIPDLHGFMTNLYDYKILENFSTSKYLQNLDILKQNWVCIFMRENVLNPKKQSHHKAKNYEIIFTVDPPTHYKEVEFSHSGRYLACINQIMTYFPSLKYISQLV